MLEIKIRPVWPVYAAGGIWLLGGILLPLYQFWGILLTAILSVIGYRVFCRFAPAKLVLVPVQEVEISTGNAESDRVLKGIKEHLIELHGLRYQNTEILPSAQLERIQQAGEGILQELLNATDKIGKVDTFASLFLPASVTVLRFWGTRSTDPSGKEHAVSKRKEAEASAALIASSFELQLDGLANGRMVDLEIDIEILQNLIKRNALPEE